MTPAPVKPVVPVSALEAIDIRVGTIRQVEAVPKSDRLLRLAVGFGDHVRTILAGMKQERADPSELVGRQARECPIEASDRGAGGADDDDIV